MLTVALLLLVGVSPAVNPASDMDLVHQDAADTSPDRTTIESLDSFSPVVTAMYDHLRLPQTRAERLRSYADLSGAMKSAVWIHHFRVALAEHPEFTDEQRAVLNEAIALFTPELFEISSSSHKWGRHVDAPIQALSERAKAVFGFTLAAQLFTQLGPTLPPAQPFALPDMKRHRQSQPQASDASSQLRRTFQPAANDELPNCECSTVNDYCAWELGSDWLCVGGGCYWGLNWGCGTGLLYRCDGLCQLQYRSL